MPFSWFRRKGDSAGRAGRRRRDRRQSRRLAAGGPEQGASAGERLEQRRRRVSIGIGASLIAIVIGVVAFGYYQEFYRPPRVWAGNVRNVQFTMGDLVQRIRVLQGVNRYQGGKVDLSTVPFEYLQNMINAEMLRQLSPQLNINITDADIDAGLRQQFQPQAAPGQETDPGQLEREFNNNYQAFLTATGLNDGDYRVILEEQLTLRRLAALIGQTIEDPQDQVEVSWIKLPLDTQANPRDVAARLAVEDFGQVAAEVTQADDFADASGYVGWVPKGAFPDLDDQIFGNEEKNISPTAPGTITRPIFTSDGTFLVKVMSGPESRELDDRMKLKLDVELVRQWQRDQLSAGTQGGWVKMNFNSKLYDWVADQVFVSAPRTNNTQNTQNN